MIDIRSFDPATETRTAWSAFHAYRRARNREERPDESDLTDAEFEHFACRQWPLYENLRWAAWSGESIVGVGGASLRREGTQDYEAHAPHVEVWGGVLEPWRRRGIATALLRPLHDLMRRRGKTLATLSTSSPDGDAFLLAIGATAKHLQIENRALVSGLDWDMLARWRSAATPAAAELRWEIHPSRVPKDRMEPLIPRINMLLADVPNGSLDEPPLRFDLTAWLTRYEEFDRHGSDHTMVMLMDGEEIAAVCETVWDARFPEEVYQRLTAVAPTWRGQSLAKRVKAAMLELIRERHPEVRFIDTSNAEVNAPMLSINSRLGFTERRRTTTYQLPVAALERAVARHGTR